MPSMFDFTTFPILTTERLRLRRMILADREAIFTIRGDYEVTKYNIGAAYTDIAQVESLIHAMASEYKREHTVRWGITLPPDDIVIGMVGFNYWNRENNNASVGFDLAQAYWRKGIMREALSAILDFGFNKDQMALHRVAADASIYNTASIQLMKSIGFQQEGILRDEYYEDGTYHDLVLLSVLEEEWQGRK